jgi:hypothetical protein
MMIIDAWMYLIDVVFVYHTLLVVVVVVVVVAVEVVIVVVVVVVIVSVLPYHIILYTAVSSILYCTVLLCVVCE